MGSRFVALGLCLLAVTAGALPAHASTPDVAGETAARARARGAIVDVVRDARARRQAAETADGAEAAEATEAAEAAEVRTPGTGLRAASAHRVHVADALGEPEILDARGDLATATYDLSVPEVATFSVTFRVGENPATSPRWREGRTSVVWGVDEDGDGEEDVYAFGYALADGRLVGEVVDADDQDWRCTGTLRWDGDSGLSVHVPSSCVTLADSRVYAFAYYDPTPGDGTAPLSIDWAPEHEPWTTAVARRAAPHPARPATTDGTRFTTAEALLTGAAQRTVALLAGGEHGLLCDRDGDGVRTPVTFSGGRWERYRDGAFRPEARFLFGQPGDVPLCGDWDGDGTETAAVYRRGQWLQRTAAGDAVVVLSYGGPDDVPVVGDWDADGVDTPGVRRGTRWYLWEPEGDAPFTFGAETDVPVVGDWDADGRDTVGVVRGGTWSVRDANSPGPAVWSWGFEAAGTRPLVSR